MGRRSAHAALAAAALVLPCVLANTPLNNNWKPLKYGQCTHKPIDPTATPPYARNDDPLVAESVVSGSVGRTCSFRVNGKARNEMSELYKENWLLAASQDLYNGMHVTGGVIGGKNGWDAKGDCNPTKRTREQAMRGEFCGQGCGVCFLVNGPKGSAVWIINEIADVRAVKTNGDGLNFHLDNDHSKVLRDGGATTKDIQYKRVPCPVTDKQGKNGHMSIALEGFWGENAMNFVVLNYRYGLKSVQVSRDQTGKNWIPLVRSWQNQWIWGTYCKYGCTTACPRFQCDEVEKVAGDKGGISSTPGGKFSLKLVDVMGHEVVCEGLSVQKGKSKKGDTWACKDKNGKKLQFDAPSSVDVLACDGKTEAANKNLYKIPIGSSKPTNPPPSNPPPTKPATGSPSKPTTGSGSQYVNIFKRDSHGSDWWFQVATARTDVASVEVIHMPDGASKWCKFQWGTWTASGMKFKGKLDLKIKLKSGQTVHQIVNNWPQDPPLREMADTEVEEGEMGMASVIRSSYVGYVVAGCVAIALLALVALVVAYRTRASAPSGESEEPEYVEMQQE